MILKIWKKLKCFSKAELDKAKKYYQMDWISYLVDFLNPCIMYINRGHPQKTSEYLRGGGSQIPMLQDIRR